MPEAGAPLDYECLRSWLFVPAADAEAIRAAAAARPDVAIAEFEDFTPSARRPEARAMLTDTLARWRTAGIVTAVRINPIWQPDGPDDLAAALTAGADIIAFPKTRGPEDVEAVAAAVAHHGAGDEDSLPDLLPNIESAAALVQTVAIASASPHVKACLVASEDMTADLQAERTRDGRALRYVRERFLVECRAAGVLPIDCPYTWTDTNGVVKEAQQARTLGYTAKSVVHPGHVAVINQAMTPDDAALAHARQVVAAFDAARAEGRDRAIVDGHAVEAPTRANAAAVLARAARLAAARDRPD